jgi:hypothetical protein
LGETNMKLWKRLKQLYDLAITYQRLPTKVEAIERRLKESGHRRCPQCGERDMRLQDKYRFKHSPFDEQRYLHEKWLCYACNHREQNDIPEPS